MTNHSAVLSSCLAAGAAFAAFGARVLAQEEVVLRSTAGQGITVVSSSATFSAFNAAFFAAAAASPQLAVEVSYPAWLVALPADAASRWLSPASGSSANFVLTQTFTIPASVIDYASLEFTFAVDDFLGDPTGPNHWGVFLNGHEVNGMHGSGHSAQQQLLAGGVGGLLAPGPNLLQVYCRDTGGTVSGVIYRARIRYWPCVAEEVIRLHSGNGPIGGPDGEVLGTPLLAGTVGPAEFAQAAMGLPATVVDLGASEPCGGLAADPAARWVWQNNHYGTLFAQPFQIRSCNLVGARVRFTHSQSASMGFGIVAGVYVNGHALQLEPVAPPLGDCDRAFEAVVPAAFLNASATNWLFVHVPSTPALPIFFPLTIYSATIRVRTPPISASLTIDSGPGVRMLTGNAYGPLRSAPFTAADFAACTANASVVAAPSGWATSLTPAQWVATDASRTPRSTLFAQDFQVPFCTASLTRVRLRFTCAVDDALGDPSGNGANPRGVYLNGTAVEASWTALGGGSVVAFERDVTGLLRDGLNTLYVYDRDLAGVKSGAVWSARIDVDPCAGSTIGAGCPGTPATIGIAVPVLGGVGSISLAHLPPSAPLALLAIGTSIPALDLGVLGAAGCLAHVAPFVMPLGVPAGGQFVYSFAVPFDPTLVGYELAAQGVYGDPAFNSSGIVSTPAAVLVVQP